MTVAAIDFLFLIAACSFSAYLIVRLRLLGLVLAIPSFWLFILAQFLVRENHNDEPLTGLPIAGFLASGVAAGVAWCLAVYGVLAIGRFIARRRKDNQAAPD